MQKYKQEIRQMVVSTGGVQENGLNARLNPVQPCVKSRSRSVMVDGSGQGVS